MRTAVLFPLIGGCMSLDGFFFNPLPLDEYAFGGDVIPEDMVEEVSFSSGKHTLAGVWVNQVEQDAPTLVYFHGNKHNIDHYWDRMEAYWSMGYRTFTFDYRGYGKSEGTPTFDGVITDGHAAIDHVEEATGRDIGELPLLGYSLGGCVASTVSGTDTPGVLITESMFASPQHLADDAAGGARVPAGWLYENPFDNVGAVASQAAPVLVIHGKGDLYIDPSHAEAVYAAASDPKALWLVPGGNHSNIIPYATADYDTQIGDWIDTHLPTE